MVVTADHGISFQPGTHPRVIGRGNAPGVMWVPLFVKEPGQHRPRVDDRNWEHVDLLPTLAGHAGVEVPWPVDGRSALWPAADDRRQAVPTPGSDPTSRPRW